MDIRLDDVLQIGLPLPLHKPVHQVAGHHGGGLVQCEELVQVACRPRAPRLQRMLNAIVLSVLF